MSTKRALSIVLVASAVMLAVGIGPEAARALPPAQAGVTIPYSGRLTDDGGQPVADGAYDFAFALYEAAEGGAPLWSETQTRVAVQGGAFTAALGSVSALPAGAGGRGLWLEVSVRGPGEAGFTLLSPRQQLSVAALLAPASPSTGPACAHDHLGETWAGAYTPGLTVQDTTTDGTGIEGIANTGSSAWGVAGYSTEGIGVYGYSANAAGVYGYGPNGVVGMSSSTGWAAVAGINNAPGGISVWGSTSAVTGTGVVAVNSIVTGTALSIDNGAFRVKGAGLNTSTTVFIHVAHTSGASKNTCYANYATVINNPLTNGDPNAILIVTFNGGILGIGTALADPFLSVQYDQNNNCTYGQRWAIYTNGTSTIPEGAKFNVMVVKP